MRERLHQMLIKEFRQIFRDPRMRTIIFIAPVVQMLLFGYAVTTDVRNVPTAVYDLDRSPASRELVARLAGSGYFQIVERAGNPARLRELLDGGKVLMALEIPPGFQAALDGGRSAELQLLVDGSDSNTAGIVLDYSGRITGDFSREALRQRLLRQTGTELPATRVELEWRAWFNQNLESRNFYVPGVIAMIVTLVTLMLTGMAIVREKEIGTMEQLLVSPVRPVEFILGKTLPFVAISLADVVLVTIVGVFWFDVPIRGSLLLLFFSTTLYLLTTLSAGLLISTISRTQQQAMMSTFLFYFPAVLLSGMVFPIANMPQIVQWLTLLNPLRYFLIIIRGVFLKGVGAAILWPQMLALAALGSAMLWLAALRFRKTLT
ncbi:MAG TPA: ABC transporter permease [Terriglobia bacterium]|jgi:ABC-2 type transport system permease protein